MDLIELKRHLKNKKPSFVQREGHKRKKLEEKWKRPKGLQNKLRMGFKSHGMAVSIGYGTPLKIRNMHSSGLIPVLVSSSNDLKKINAKTHGILLSSKIGLRKKILLLKKIMELSLPVLNIKDIQMFIKKSEELLKNRKQIKKQKEDKKKSRAENVKKQTKKEEKELTAEEKEKQDELEKRKVLESKK